MHVLLLLFIEFFKIGLFAVGGGLATMPFLYDLADRYDWFTKTQLIDMIAISESTPGPIGINMATFAGYHAGGIPGAIVASLAVVVPSLIIIIAIAKVLDRFRENRYVNAAFYGLRAAAAALIASAALDIMRVSLLMGKLSPQSLLAAVNWPGVVLFGVIYWLLVKYKKHPILYIGLAAVVGIFIPM